MRIKLTMASTVIKHLQEYIDEYGDMPVVLSVASAEEAISMVQSDAVVTVSKDDSDHSENWIILADFDLTEENLDSALNPEEEK